MAKKEEKVTKKSLKKERQIAILKEKEEYEERIDKLIDEKYEAKKNKDKDKVKEINKEINKLKKERSEVGTTDTFFGSVKAEMKLVRWPSRKEVVKYSIAVLGFVIFFACFFLLLDTLFALFYEFVKGLM